MSESALRGVRILVVEDEAMLFFLAEDMLADLGCTTVWHASRLGEALELLERERPDLAMLDVNLAGEPVYPLAQRLALANIPFVFATGYGSAGIPREFATRPVIQKPFTMEMLGDALGAALRSNPAGDTARTSPEAR